MLHFISFVVSYIMRKFLRITFLIYSVKLTLEIIMQKITRKTKIICTLGPATDDPRVLEKMMLAGLDVARFNFSHGSYEDHTKRLEELVKDSGTFGSSKLKDFARMKFDSDDDFDDYLSEVRTDLDAYNKENPRGGKSTMGIPPVIGSGKKGNEDDVLSEDDIKALVPGDPQ